MFIFDLKYKDSSIKKLIFEIKFLILSIVN